MTRLFSTFALIVLVCFSMLGCPAPEDSNLTGTVTIRLGSGASLPANVYLGMPLKAAYTGNASGAGFIYQWRVNNTSLDLHTEIITATQVGEYTVMVSHKDFEGSINSDSVTVANFPNSESNKNFNGDIYIESNDNDAFEAGVTLTAKYIKTESEAENADDFQTIFYTWFFKSSATADPIMQSNPNPDSAIFKTPINQIGTYYVQVYAEGFNPKTFADKYVTVNQPSLRGIVTLTINGVKFNPENDIAKYNIGTTLMADFTARGETVGPFTYSWDYRAAPANPADTEPASWSISVHQGNTISANNPGQYLARVSKAGFKDFLDQRVITIIGLPPQLEGTLTLTRNNGEKVLGWNDLSNTFTWEGGEAYADGTNLKAGDLLTVTYSGTATGIVYEWWVADLGPSMMMDGKEGAVVKEYTQIPGESGNTYRIPAVTDAEQNDENWVGRAYKVLARSGDSVLVIPGTSTLIQGAESDIASFQMRVKDITGGGVMPVFPPLRL